MALNFPNNPTDGQHAAVVDNASASHSLQSWQ